MKGLPGYLLYRVLSGLFGLLPAPVVRVTGRTIGTGLSRVAGKRMGLLRRHMRRVMGPEPSETEINAAAREMFASYGRYWAEVFWFRPRRKEDVVRRARVTGLDDVFEAKRDGRGIIFAVPHMGNWEVAGSLAETLDLNVLSVAEDLPNPRITDWFVRTRAAYGIEIIVAGRGSTTTPLARALKDGQVVALVADRDVTGNGIEVEFFGETTTMPAGPVSLALMSGAAIFPIGSQFDGAGYFFPCRPELLIPEDENRSKRVRLGTQALARAYEDLIREKPTDWHLFSPNWPSDRTAETSEE
ncbi:MAG: phosphatidylinositol mannoside acyltransferase [Actinomycetota bacterium]|nr:phosphatidylinositol mannoside acyltransferase [Actinomycetota bacterium]